MHEMVCMCIQCPSLDVKQTLYQLLFQFLQYNWRYFFRSSVMAVKGVTTGETPSQNVDNRVEFVAIIQVANNTKTCQPSADILCGNHNPELFELKLGTPVSPIMGDVCINFFCFFF